MIYGQNFNGTHIPQGVKRKFRQYVPIDNEVSGHTGRRRVMARLVGVGQSVEERDTMLVTANNGHRRLWVETRKTPAGPWFGIYVY